MSLNRVLSASNARSAPISDILTPGRIAAIVVMLMAVIVALWPLGLTSDYFNHLARNHIEAQVWFDANLQDYYAVSIAIIPDLTMDMIVPWLSHLTGIYAAGAVTVWIAFVLPPLAGLLIARNLYGQIPWVALAAFFVMFNENMQWGFVNFVASTGLALFGFALWMRSEPSWRRAFLFAPWGAFLVLNHALAFLLFGYLVLLWEIACFVHGQRGTRWGFLRQLAMKDAIAMAPGVILVVLAMGGSSELTHVGVTSFAILPKLQSLWSAVSFFNSSLARIVSVVLVGALCIGLNRGILHMESRMVWVCSGMLILVVAMPTSILGIWGLQYRYPGILIILVVCSIRFDPDATGRAGRLAAIATGALLFTLLANGALQMSRIDNQARMLRDVIAGLPQGARLLPARHESADLSYALHSAGLAVIDRSAFVPNLFTNTSPVDVSPAMRDLHMPQAWPLLEGQLRESMRADLPRSANGYWSRQYYFGWPEHWDYVLYFRSDAAQSLTLEPLCLIDERPLFALYRVADHGCDTAD